MISASNEIHTESEEPVVEEEIDDVQDPVDTSGVDENEVIDEQFYQEEM